MDISPEDEQVVELLSKLKSSNGGYPSDMLESRRQTYLKQVANVGLGIGAGLKNTAKGNGAGAAATVTSKILETALIAAIAIEASTAAYLYRDKIADAVKTYTGKANVQVVARPTNNTSLTNPEVVEIIETSSATSTSGTPTVTASSGTPSPDLAGNTTNNITPATTTTINSTPNPGGNNGNQYGLTPKPVRTKDNQNNNNTGGSGTGGSTGGGPGNGNGNGNGNGQ